MMHGPGDPGDNLDEVKVTAQKIDSSLDPVQVNVKRIDSTPLPEITVQGVRIPWWVWGLVGALAVMMLVNKGSRR